MPAKTLLSFQSVHLKVPAERIISQPGRRVSCEICGEEIMNEREVVREGRVLCKSCAGSSYYSVVAEFSFCAPATFSSP